MRSGICFTFDSKALAIQPHVSALVPHVLCCRVCERTGKGTILKGAQWDFFKVGYQNEVGMIRLPVTQLIFLNFKTALLSLLLLHLFSFFGRATRNVGSEFLGQGLNPGPGGGSLTS